MNWLTIGTDGSKTFRTDNVHGDTVHIDLTRDVGGYKISWSYWNNASDTVYGSVVMPIMGLSAACRVASAMVPSIISGDLR